MLRPHLYFPLDTIFYLFKHPVAPNYLRHTARRGKLQHNFL